MMTIATITEIGRLYMSVVVGMTIAVHTPDGMMYATSAGTLSPPHETSWFEVAARRPTQPRTSTAATQIRLLASVLLKRYVISGIFGSRSTVKYFTRIPVRT